VPVESFSENISDGKLTSFSESTGEKSMAEWPGNLPRNAFKQALAKGERQIGLWSGLTSTMAAEILAGAGFDWIVLDGEHAPNDISTLLPQLQAMRGGTAEPVFRVPWNEPVIIKRALDVGARSLLMPFVQSVDAARRAVAATRYPPLGIRGVAVVPRANDYGRVQNYHRNAHLDTCVLVQVETRKALKEIEGIAAVEGIDGIFIGPSDLAADFGHLGNPKHPDVQEAIKEAGKRIRAAGKAAGTLAGNVDDVESLMNLGFNFTAAGSDVGILARGAEGVAARFAKK
jgi:4-hydroxy-2-oxoheptanedioate aldolase